MFLRDSRILDMSLLSNLVSIRCNIQMEHFPDRYSTRNHMHVYYILDQPSADHISSITLIYYRMYLSLSLAPSHSIVFDFQRIRNAFAIVSLQCKTITVLETPYIQYYRKYVTAEITANRISLLPTFLPGVLVAACEQRKYTIVDFVLL